MISALLAVLLAVAVSVCVVRNLYLFVARLWRRSFARTRRDALDATGGLAADSQRPSTASLGPDIFKKRLGYRVSHRSQECKSQCYDNRLDLVRGGHL